MSIKEIGASVEVIIDEDCWSSYRYPQIKGNAGTIVLESNVTSACCGIGELTNIHFNRNKGATWVDMHNLLAAGLPLLKKLASYAKHREDDWSYNYRVGRFIMSDIPSRKGSSIYKAGKNKAWQVVGKPTRNPKTGNRITLYTMEV